MTTVSIVIPTIGSPSLPATLEALAGQVDPPDFEIRICVDGVRPHGLSVDLGIDLGAVRRHPRCRCLEVVRLAQRQGVSVARNTAAAGAAGDLLGFLDDDVIPSPTWVTELSAALATWPAVTGRILEVVDGSTLSRLRRLAFDHRHGVNLAAAANQVGGSGTDSVRVDYLHGGNCAIRAEVFRGLGGFDPAFTKSQDRELAWRLGAAGHAIGYWPELQVRHAGHYTWRGLVRGRYAAGRANASLLRSGSLVAVGPTGSVDTYGMSLPALARRHGPRLAFAATVSVAAQRLGRLRPGHRSASCERVRPGRGSA